MSTSNETDHETNSSKQETNGKDDKTKKDNLGDYTPLDKITRLQGKLEEKKEKSE